MTISRGMPWGEARALPADAPVVSSDEALARAVAEDMATGRTSIIGLRGGDLHRTVGAPSHNEDELRAGQGMALPVDVGLVEFDDDQGPIRRVFVAHLVATTDRRGRLWRGRTLVAMNAAFRGTENLAPRGHPNDGRLDVTDGSLRWVERRRAARRAYAGAHVPHPNLGERRVSRIDVESDQPLHMRVDGLWVGATRHLRISCIPDAATIVV